MMALAPVSAARKAAFKILLSIERGEAHSDDLLRAHAVTALLAADRNLATALVLGVLRWQIRLDHQIRSLLKRPDAKLDPEVLVALRLGAFQLLNLDRIPAHAAIDESVELAKQSGHRFAAGMVNAVLRKMTGMRAREAAIVETAPPLAGAEGGCPVHSTTFSEACLAYPAWMAERWKEVYGATAAGAICLHGLSQPQLSLRIQDPGAEAELIEAGIQVAPGKLLRAARTVVAGDVTATPAFRAGRLRIQDEGSQLVGEIAAAVAANLNEGAKSILDACAAPGGKTLILAERLPLAHLVACEASPRRLAAMRERLSAFADRIEFRPSDAATLDENEAFDFALADVPCSGTGTLGRNPEIRHRLGIEDLARQAERQGAILKTVLRAVRPGGRLVYSTCSLEPEENEQVVAKVVAESANVREVSVGESIEDLRRRNILSGAGGERLAKCISPKGALRLLPGTFGTDGFFVVALERTA